ESNPEDLPADDHFAESNDAEEKAKEAERKAREEREARQRAEREREAQERAERENEAKARNRDKIGTGSIPADLLQMIDLAHKQQDHHPKRRRPEFRTTAIDQARELSKPQPKTWLRRAIRQANANAVMPNGERDHPAQLAKRELHISEPD